jgi:hypothetical protein
MARAYTAQFNGVAITALQDLFEVLAASTKITRVLGWSLVQTTDLGDAAEEILRVETVRGIGSTSGTGGTTPTAQPRCDSDAAYGGTVEVNNTTRMTAGTLETLEQYGWNVRIPWTHFYTPETQPVITAGNRWTLSLPAAPTDSLTVSGHLWLEEEG